MEATFCQLVSWSTDHIRSVKLVTVCFYMLYSLPNVLVQHLLVQFLKSTFFNSKLYWGLKIPLSLIMLPKKIIWKKFFGARPYGLKPLYGMVANIKVISITNTNLTLKHDSHIYFFCIFVHTVDTLDFYHALKHSFKLYICKFLI